MSIDISHTVISHLLFNFPLAKLYTNSLVPPGSIIHRVLTHVLFRAMATLNARERFATLFESCPVLLIYTATVSTVEESVVSFKSPSAKLLAGNDRSARVSVLLKLNWRRDPFSSADA